ncbi:MAG: arginine--tRNA ligase [Flavobacteriales bacterium]|nr:arginine--tRNA ligase [Flavobacteriales bacterium]
MNFQLELAQQCASILNKLSNYTDIIEPKDILINLTPPEYPGDYTLVLFPFVKKLGMNPQQIGEAVGKALLASDSRIENFNLVKGFLNLELKKSYWKHLLYEIYRNESFYLSKHNKTTENVIIEYPSPNTNKPLHLGHLRNIFLGFSLSRILEANGHKVYQVCLYNDRGTNISKSMLAYMLSEKKLTPENSGIKGDKLVGDYYVVYNELSKKAIEELKAQGLTEEEAKKQNPLEKEIADLTVRWETGDEEVVALWKTMNHWFYEGVEQTYKMLHLKFDKFYYESDVYNLGRQTVKEGLEKGVFFQKPDGSVWIDLTDVGLDEKLVLRSNGTTVYITQDIALAYQKQKDFEFDRSIYVVGNEQDYHFKVLFEILRRLGMKASDKLYHLSYGMVELPTGKMKSREGTVVDADDLINDVIKIAKETANEQGKLSEVDESKKEEIYKQIGIGALRYFILKVDPKKKMIFNPEESIDFNGNTGPFIQYIYARTQSLLRNATQLGLTFNIQHLSESNYTPNLKETQLIRWMAQFPLVIKEAGINYSPALIANYVYELACLFSNFYHDYKVLKEDDSDARQFRLALTDQCGKTIQKALYLLGIDAPERM